MLAAKVNNTLRRVSGLIGPSLLFGRSMQTSWGSAGFIGPFNRNRFNGSKSAFPVAEILSRPLENSLIFTEPYE